MVTYELIHLFKRFQKQFNIQKSHRFVFLNLLRFIWSPFALLYGFILSVRNQCFNIGVLKSFRSNIFTIGIGNLSVGGTGKTPFTAYLIEDLLKNNKKIAVVSRGYGRTSKGLLEVQNRSKANEVGDEPLLLKQRYPEVHIWVAEKRAFGVKEAEKAGVDVILLDDNFQHRSVGVHFQFMLTKFSEPFFTDYPMPMGRLREFRSGAKRADAIIYTNAPENYKQFVQTYMLKTRVYSQADVRFARHQTLPMQWKSKTLLPKKVLAVSGIANPTGFINACKAQWADVIPLSYKDHKRYGNRDKSYILQMLDKLGAGAGLVCTEKDWVKLDELFTDDEKQHYPMGFMPVTIQMDHFIQTTELLKRNKL